MTLLLHSLYSFFLLLIFSVFTSVPPLCACQHFLYPLSQMVWLHVCMEQRIRKHHLILSASHQVQHTLLLSSSFALLYFFEKMKRIQPHLCAKWKYLLIYTWEINNPHISIYTVLNANWLKNAFIWNVVNRIKF